MPLAIGAVTEYLRRPWLWGALLAVAVFLIAAIAPEPEEGESRVDGGDLGFLLVVAILVAVFTWFGAWVTRRVRRTID